MDRDSPHLDRVIRPGAWPVELSDHFLYISSRIISIPRGSHTWHERHDTGRWFLHREKTLSYLVYVLELQPLEHVCEMRPDSCSENLPEESFCRNMEPGLVLG